MSAPVLTIDDLIVRLEAAKKVSKLGGNTVVHLCEDFREYVPISDTVLDEDQDGAVFLLKLWENHNEIKQNQIKKTVEADKRAFQVFQATLNRRAEQDEKHS